MGQTNKANILALGYRFGPNFGFHTQQLITALVHPFFVGERYRKKVDDIITIFSHLLLTTDAATW